MNQNNYIYLEQKTAPSFINVLKLEDFKQFSNVLKSFSSVKLKQQSDDAVFSKDPEEIFLEIIKSWNDLGCKGP